MITTERIQTAPAARHDLPPSQLSLFAPVPDAFYQAYGKNPEDADFQHRARLYNLYHLLNHFNLFGGGYLGAVSDSTNALLRY
ncbi:MAG TPA: fructosamine kinase family protein [Alcanivorax sp.]|nr:fructosamine kinase family protein [Alcanivorax sp.]